MFITPATICELRDGFTHRDGRRRAAAGNGPTCRRRGENHPFPALSAALKGETRGGGAFGIVSQSLLNDAVVSAPVAWPAGALQGGILLVTGGPFFLLESEFCAYTRCNSLTGSSQAAEFIAAVVRKSQRQMRLGNVIGWTDERKYRVCLVPLGFDELFGAIGFRLEDGSFAIAAGREACEFVKPAGTATHSAPSFVHSANGERAVATDAATDASPHGSVSQSLPWNEATYRELVESFHDGIWRLDSNWDTTFVNRRIAEMLGTRPSEMIGRNVREFLDQNSDSASLRACMQTTPGANPAELRFRLPNGELLLALVSSVPAYNGTGEPSGILLTISDITRRKRIEAELKRCDAELAHVSRLNTMGEFMAGITHEIRQPLHAITTFASACQKSLETQSGQNLSDLLHWTSQISKQAHRIAAIIGRMSKFVRRHSETALAPFDLNRLAEEMLEMLAAEIRRHRIRVELALSPEVPLVEGDDVQIAQVVVNLVRNAIDAMIDVPSTQRRLCLRTALVDEGLVELAVEDAGPGFTEDRAAQLFEPFYTTKPNGMGMGLAISRSIAEVHRGELTAASLPGHGATFRLKLPLKHPRASL